MAGAGVLRRLREETRDHHLRAEQLVRILDADASLADYVRYLRTMLGYHAPVEGQLRESIALATVGFDARARCRAHLLEHDLRSLGDHGPWHRCSALPDSSSLPRALGIAYVLEGSTLGGRYILAKLPPSIAVIRPYAARFLTGYGSETGAFWRAFMAIAERGLATEADAGAAVAAACETFGTLTAWLALHETPDARRARVAS